MVGKLTVPSAAATPNSNINFPYTTRVFNELKWFTFKEIKLAL